MNPFIYLLVTATVVVIANGFSFNCNDNKMHNCHCLPGPTEIFCNVGENDEFSIQIEPLPRVRITIQCKTANNYSTNFHDLIPDIKINNDIIFKLKYENCPLPKNSFADILAKFGAKSTNNLHVEISKHYNETLEKKHFAGLESMNALLIKNMMHLPDNLFDDLSNLTRLAVLNGKIKITNETFLMTTKLEELEFYNNDLKSFPIGAFSHLTKLKKLLTYIQPDLQLNPDDFIDMSSVEDLDLHANQLKSLPEHIFDPLTNLTIISLMSNNFSVLPENLFRNNKKLRIIKLLHNNIPLTSLPKRFLADLSVLDLVDLSYCDIEEVSPDIFESSHRISQINLSNNNLKVLPSELFRSQTNLMALDLSNNDLKILPENIFPSLAPLQKLNLNYNKLEVIKGNTFDNLRKLTQLTISHNNLKVIELLSQNDNLKKIDISFNKLDFRRKSEDYGGYLYPFQNLLNLEELNLSHNKITQFFDEWQISDVELKYLNLSSNLIDKIEFSDIHTISNNIVIDLRYNNIAFVNFSNYLQLLSGSDDSTSKRKIYVDHNPFDCSCKLYEFIEYLQRKLDPRIYRAITISADNALCVGPDDKEGRSLMSLTGEELYCLLDNPNSHGSKLCPTECDCFTFKYDNSVAVHCENKVTDEVPEFPVSNEFSYIEVHLEDNSLTHLTPGSFRENVKKIYLNNNNLTDLEVGVIPTDIKVLDLRNNRISRLKKETVSMIASGAHLEALNMSGNPIVCDCDNFDLISSLQKHYKKVKDYNDVTCIDGRKISDLTIGSLCGTSTAIVVISVLIAITGLLSGIMAALFYKYKNEVKAFLFAKGLFLSLITEEELDKDKKYDAFISYSHKDEYFVINELVSNLENGPHPFKLCVHYRDWLVGGNIHSSIQESVNESRRTIIVLSPNFVESVWGKVEFETAYNNAIEEGRVRLIVILYGDIGDIDNLDDKFKKYLKRNTYIKWGDSMFWDKLRYAMPHPSLEKGAASTQIGEKKKSFDDRRELITSNGSNSPTTPVAHDTPPHQGHVNPIMNGYFNSNSVISMNDLRINGNAKHSDV